MQNPLTRVLTWYQSLGFLARQGAILLAAFLVGILVMPWIIYLAGRTTLGSYGNSGPFSLWGDFFRGLFDFSFAYWFAACGPLLILLLIALWRKFAR
jgi:hypothetical protein